MQMTLHKSVIVDAIKRVLPAVPGKTSLPILEHVLLEYDGTTLTVTATDLEIRLSYTVILEGGEPGAVTLPGKMLYALLGKMPDQAMTVTANENHQVTLTADEAEYTLYGLPADEYPVAPIRTAGTEITMPAQQLRGMIKQTLFATSDDASRVVLTGVAFQLEGDTLHIIATDTHRLTVSTTRAFSVDGDAATVAVIIPARALTEIVRAIGKTEDPVTLRMFDNQLVVGIDHLHLASRLIEGEYLKWRHTLRESSPITVTLDASVLLAAIERAAIVARTESSKVVLHAAGDRLSISAKTQEGKARERLPAIIVGESVEIAFNADYLREAISAMDTDEVSFGLLTPTAPAIITGKGVRDYLCLTMPMNVL